MRKDERDFAVAMRLTKTMREDLVRSGFSSLARISRYYEARERGRVQREERREERGERREKTEERREVIGGKMKKEERGNGGGRERGKEREGKMRKEKR